MKGATLAQIIDKLRQIYCGNIGVEYASHRKPRKADVA